MFHQINSSDILNSLLPFQHFIGSKPRIDAISRNCFLCPVIKNNSLLGMVVPAYNPSRRQMQFSWCWCQYVTETLSLVREIEWNKRRPQASNMSMSCWWQLFSHISASISLAHFYNFSADILDTSVFSGASIEHLNYYLCWDFHLALWNIKSLVTFGTKRLSKRFVLYYDWNPSKEFLPLED